MNDYKGREGESSVVVRKRFKEKQQQQQQQPFPSTRAIINQQHRRCASLPNNTQYEESETDVEVSDVSVSEGDDTSWISWFCNLRGNEFFCEVDDDFVQDDFNLCGLSSQVPYYDYALDLILDVESSHGDTFTEDQNELIESAAEMLYGLIHARYILTSKGMAAMIIYSFTSTKTMTLADVQEFSALDNPAFQLASQMFLDIDGAYFGATFPHLFLMTYGNLKPQKQSQNYVPRVFGFKVHKS
ncbi:hypothetical protein JHK87_047252 [Glycine soja]|nr:hypothetical protein JHK87_047252 [Glycine soja]